MSRAEERRHRELLEVLDRIDDNTQRNADSNEDLLTVALEKEQLKALRGR